LGATVEVWAIDSPSIASPRYEAFVSMSQGRFEDVLSTAGIYNQPLHMNYKCGLEALSEKRPKILT